MLYARARSGRRCPSDTAATTRWPSWPPSAATAARAHRAATAGTARDGSCLPIPHQAGWLHDEHDDQQQVRQDRPDLRDAHPPEIVENRLRLGRKAGERQQLRKRRVEQAIANVWMSPSPAKPRAPPTASRDRPRPRRRTGSPEQLRQCSAWVTARAGDDAGKPASPAPTPKTPISMCGTSWSETGDRVGGLG